VEETEVSERISWQRRGLLVLLVGLGCLALLNYFSWWFGEWQLGQPWLLLFLVAAAMCALPQLLGNWLLYLKAMPYHSLPELDYPFTVDVYVTAYCEDPIMVRDTLRAARDMSGEHRTWLLDDSPDHRFARLATESRVGYLARDDRNDAKAGNVNAALARTDGEIIVIFDIDHAPTREFLQESISFFHNSRIGFVQVMLTFSNGHRSWIARAATESSLDYYNPTCRGAARLRGVTLTGSNALIRRAALESIGGYQAGLAEDLATSIALHGAGWQSVYVPRPLAPGLAPEDLHSWSIQQFKWSRGVFELLLTRLPLYWTRLANGQRVSYLVRMTYYWIGPVVFAHLLATALVLFSGSPTIFQAFNDYLVRLAPLGAVAMLIRQVALTNFRPEGAPALVLSRPTVLVFGTWPIYTLAWIVSLLRIPIGFQPTPKTPTGRVNPWWLAPQISSILLLVAGSIYGLFVSAPVAVPVAVFALLMALAQVPFLAHYKFRSSRGGSTRSIPAVVNEAAESAD
jgi:cellulose synthase (UDP-forming)